MSKPTPEQVCARRDLARVTAEIDVQMGGSDHRVNLAECHLALSASHADLLSALKAAKVTLEGIRDAKPAEWDESLRDQFQPWAKNRSRNEVEAIDAAIAKAEA